MNPARTRVPDLEAIVAKLMKQVPAGRVTTFGRLATALGETHAARWLASDWVGICERRQLAGHRVVLKDGRLPDFGCLNPEEQADRLADEGIPVSEGSVPLQGAAASLLVEIKAPNPRPLDRLRDNQDQLLRRAELIEPSTKPRLVAGVDVSYVSPHVGIACYAMVDADTGALVDAVTHRADVRFPYIPGFLGYREVPLYLDLLGKVRKRGLKEDVMLVDGNGLLHPRLAGVATHLGIVAERPTIGVSKSLLCGKIADDPRKGELPIRRPGSRPGKAKSAARNSIQPRAVVFEERVIAHAIWPGQSTEGIGKPIFISAGHRVTLEWSMQVIQQLLRGHKLPEPIYWADQLSRKVARGGDL